ncbi:MAG: acetolactate synthase small subunit [Chloroflexi bacterium]|jgi:acetolactate synthase-1/3 small subunit|nr:MAG: acetolactate synthase small subunit [SAR202 cluster bacterium]MBG94932.1 acetolactate synthase small subunit [Chloroflexota bacterium]MQG81409.1 acetolactate synthase small subunit [SAR202 cluster bacterium]|tara:strand:+ start:400 stop:978 length:579 start_codon:yes stop_codon:yes gene_type:complete
MTKQNNYHTIISLVQDKPGVLARVASLFRRRGFNIASLAVGHSEEPGLSRMTFVVDGDQYTVDQATKQLDKLVDIVKVSDISEADVVARELALIKVSITDQTRSQIIEIVQLFRAKIVDVGTMSLVVETTGEEAKIDALIELLQPFNITELMRTGRVAMVRGKSTGEISDDYSTNSIDGNKNRALAREVGSY